MSERNDENRLLLVAWSGVRHSKQTSAAAAAAGVRMQVASQSIVLMSNAEVLDLLKEVSSKGKKSKKSQSNTATISYETMKYLEDTPAALIPDVQLIRELTLKLKPFNLTRSEKLEIVNHLPTSLVELQLVIEESEERLTEDQMNEILNIVTSFVESITPSNDTDESMDTSPAAGDPGH